MGSRIMSIQNKVNKRKWKFQNLYDTSVCSIFLFFTLLHFWCIYISHTYKYKKKIEIFLLSYHNMIQIISRYNSNAEA